MKRFTEAFVNRTFVPFAIKRAEQGTLQGQREFLMEIELLPVCIIAIWFH